MNQQQIVEDLDSSANAAARTPPQPILDEIQQRGYIPHHWHDLSSRTWQCDAHHLDRPVNCIILVAEKHVTVFEQVAFFTVSPDAAEESR